MQHRVLHRRTQTNLTRADRMGCAASGPASSPGRSAAAAPRGLAQPRSLLYQGYTGSNPMFRPLGIRVNAYPAEAGAGETIVLDEVITVGCSRDELCRFGRELARRAGHLARRPSRAHAKRAAERTPATATLASGSALDRGLTPRPRTERRPRARPPAQDLPCAMAGPSAMLAPG